MRSDDNKLIEWLNTLIVMSQWDKSLPLYFGRLFCKPEQYKVALSRIRQTQKNEPLPEPAGDALTAEEWQKLYELTSCATPLRQLFADARDPLKGAPQDKISVLAEVSDLTTHSQTVFYSRNGTFQLVLEAVRKTPQINTKELITDCLNKFYTFFATNEKMAGLLYKLALSNDWHLVLASLYDRRDYTSDGSPGSKVILDKWNTELTSQLRSILLKPSNLYRAPKRLVKVAWERQSLFEKALSSIPDAARLPAFELQQKVSNEAYKLFVAEAPDELAAVEAELQLLAVVAGHYFSVRKFAKLDGLVYTWPTVASLAMANYANLEYVEKLFLERMPSPTPAELEARDATDLYGLCANNPTLIRFLRLQPYFKEIDENEMRRYRPLATVKISDPTQPQTRTSTPLPPNVPIADAPPVAPVFSTATSVCEFTIDDIGPAGATTKELRVSLKVLGKEVKEGNASFSIPDLLQRMLHSIGAKSEDSLQSVLQNYFSGTNAEQVLVRAGVQLHSAIIGQAGLGEQFKNALKSDALVRLIIASESEELCYLPWEWFALPGSTAPLLSSEQFSLVRSMPVRVDLPPPPLSHPIEVMGLFPNAPIGARAISESSAIEVEKVARAGGSYQSIMGSEATFDNVASELRKVQRQIVHFEGYVESSEQGEDLKILFSWLESPTKPIELAEFASLLGETKVQLLIVGRNESRRVYGNPGPVLGTRLVKTVPAVLAPVRAVDEVTANSLMTEFYQSFFAGNSLEQALYRARRKVASRGSDWTSFALFANPSVLDYFQPLPPTA